MDGFRSFRDLCDNLPAWHERLDSLSAQAVKRHAEFRRLSRNSAATFSNSLRKVRKTGSAESLRPALDDDTVTPVTPPTTTSTPLSPGQTAIVQSPTTIPTPVRVDIDPDSKRLFQEYRAQAKRKRNTGSAASTSFPTPLRPKTGVVVYYDSDIQEAFSWLVRTIASARNTLRKGKTAASLKARLSGMGMEENPFRGDRMADFSLRNPNIPRLTRGPGPRCSAAESGAYDPLPFEAVDKELEAAQSLCELGAHQFLRDGNCIDELSGTKERFNNVFKIAAEQRAAYEEEAKQEEQEKERQAAMPQPVEVDVMPYASRPQGISMDPYSIAVDGAIAVDPSFPTAASIGAGSVAVDSNIVVDSKLPPPGSIAVDPALLDPSSIAVDSSVAVYPVHAAGPNIPTPDSILVDSSIAAESHAPVPNSLRVNPNLPSASSIAVESSPSRSGSIPIGDNIAVDPSVAVDPNHATREIISSDPRIAMDMRFDPASIGVDQNYSLR